MSRKKIACLPKPRAVFVVEPDAGIQGLMVRVMARAAAGLPVYSAKTLESVTVGDNPLVIYDVAAGWHELIAWRQVHSTVPLIVLVSAVPGIDRSDLRLLAAITCLTLPFSCSELEVLVQQICTGEEVSDPAPVIS